MIRIKSKGEPIPHFSDTFDTKYRAKNFTDTDSDTNTNPYSYTVACIYQSSNELFASRHISSCIYEAF